VTGPFPGRPPGAWPDPLPIEPLVRSPDAVVAVPGSKSITNRALVCAALANGRSALDGALVADDTEAMLACLRTLGAQIAVDGPAARITVTGTGGRLRPGPLTVDARQSGTTARFVMALLALGTGAYRLDGAAQLRARPMGPGITALRDLGVVAAEEGDEGRLPLRVEADRLRGGRVAVGGAVSSQFVSGLLLAAPAMPAGLRVELSGALVSRPYVELTMSVMRAFGAAVRWSGDALRVDAVPYRPSEYRVEPDASAGSYFLAAAAITGGRVILPGLGRGSLQGDLGFAALLARMGARVIWHDDAVEVVGTGALRGIEADLSGLSDTAPTLAATAAFADSPTRVRGIGFVRGKESDRIHAVVTELRRCGIGADEADDGFVVHPGAPKPAVVQTYDDHRMAMSFALLGLRAPGIAIAGPGCVAKTFPGYWAALDSLR